jgi:hypothetical protein
MLLLLKGGVCDATSPSPLLLLLLAAQLFALQACADAAVFAGVPHC